MLSELILVVIKITRFLLLDLILLLDWFCFFCLCRCFFRVHPQGLLGPSHVLRVFDFSLPLHVLLFFFGVLFTPLLLFQIFRIYLKTLEKLIDSLDQPDQKFLIVAFLAIEF